MITKRLFLVLTIFVLLVPVVAYANTFDTWTVDSSPVIQKGSPGSWDDNQIVDAGVYYIGGEYKMYYSGYKSGYKYQIGYASSPDMKTWTKKGVVLTPLASETSGVSFSKIIQLPDGKYRMYYKNLYATPPYDSVSFAESTDGISWTRVGNNIINCNPATFYDIRFDPESIYYDANSNPAYLMIFGAYHDAKFMSGRATSNDGVSWTIDPNPVLIPGSSGQWDSYGAYSDAVEKIDGTYYLLYQGIDQPVAVSGNSNGHWQLGIATSTDTINWIKYPQPVVGVTQGFPRWSSENPSDPIVTPDGTKYFSVMCAGQYHMTSYDLVGMYSDIVTEPTPTPTPTITIPTTIPTTMITTIPTTITPKPTVTKTNCAKGICKPVKSNWFLAMILQIFNIEE